MSAYPPGVTGTEWEIAGYPDCGACGHADTLHAEPGPCEVCDCEGYTPYPEGPDPDAWYDRQRDDALLWGGA